MIYYYMFETKFVHKKLNLYVTHTMKSVTI